MINIRSMTRCLLLFDQTCHLSSAFFTCVWLWERQHTLVDRYDSLPVKTYFDTEESNPTSWFFLQINGSAADSLVKTYCDRVLGKAEPKYKAPCGGQIYICAPRRAKYFWQFWGWWNSAPALGHLTLHVLLLLLLLLHLYHQRSSSWNRGPVPPLPTYMFSPENTMDARQITCIWQTVKASCRGWVSTIWYHKPDNSILNSKHLKWHFWTCSFCKTLSFISKRKILKKNQDFAKFSYLLYKCENAANKWTACSGLCLKEVKIVATFHNKICGGFWHFLGQSWVNFAESKAWSLFSKSDNLKSLLPKGKVLQRKKSSWYISKSTMVLKPKRLRRLKIGSSIFWEQLQFHKQMFVICQ